MNNINITIPSDEVTKLVEKHLNAMLSADKRAKVTGIGSSNIGDYNANIPNLQLSVTFGIVEVN